MTDANHQKYRLGELESGRDSVLIREKLATDLAKLMPTAFFDHQRIVPRAALMKTLPKLSRLFDHMLDTVMKSSCALCDRAASDVCCVDCWRQIQHCQLDVAGGIEQISLSFGQGSEQSTTRLVCWGAYQGSLKRAIANLKYGQQEALGNRLGRELGRLWIAANAMNQDRSQKPFPKSTLVVPIPLHAEKQARRGYNQAELIAAGFCDVTGLRLSPSLLERVRSTEAQFGLSATKRELNLTGAFRINRTVLRRYGLHPAQPMPHPCVILVDDIYTTGATIRAAADCLSQQRIPVIDVAAVSRPRHG